MKTTTLNTALIAAGVLAVGTAGAFSLNPGWLDKAKAGISPASTAAINASRDGCRAASIRARSASVCGWYAIGVRRR